MLAVINNHFLFLFFVLSWCAFKFFAMTFGSFECCEVFSVFLDSLTLSFD